MSAACPRALELGRLLDGEATENRAAELRSHVEACRACAAELDAQRSLVARISAPVPDLPPDGAVEAVMKRLDHAALPVRRPAPLRLGRVLGGLAAVSALGVAVALLLPRGAQDAGEFRARGSAVDWSRRVGVEIWALEASPRKIASGDRLPPGVALVGSFSNVDPAPAYLLAFALDSRGEVHWIYPAFLDPHTDPESIRLDASVVHRALPESVILQDVAPGAARLVLVVTRTPLHVSNIESAPAAKRSRDALRARWPDARVDDFPVVFGSSSPTVREVHP